MTPLERIEKEAQSRPEYLRLKSTPVGETASIVFAKGFEKGALYGGNAVLQKAIEKIEARKGEVDPIFILCYMDALSILQNLKIPE